MIRLCVSCWLRLLSTGKLTLLVLLLLVTLAVSHTSIFYAGRWFERSGLATAWQKVADGVIERDVRKQVAAKERHP